MLKGFKTLFQILMEFQPSNLGFRTPVVFINLYCFWFLMEAFCLWYFTPFEPTNKQKWSNWSLKKKIYHLSYF